MCAAQRPGDMPRKHLNIVTELREALQRTEKIARTLSRFNGKVRARRRTNKQRVTRQHPLLIDHKRAVLRAVTRRVNHTDRNATNRDHVTIVERIVRIFSLGNTGDRRWHTMLQRKPPMTRKVVGMGVRLKHPHDLHPKAFGRLNVLLDPERRIDNNGLTSRGIAHEIAPAPQILVNKLLKHHTTRLPANPGVTRTAGSTGRPPKSRNKAMTATTPRTTPIEIVRAEIDTIVNERLALRQSGATANDLDRNRKQLADAQRRLSELLSMRHPLQLVD